MVNTNFLTQLPNIELTKTTASTTILPLRGSKINVTFSVQLSNLSDDCEAELIINEKIPAEYKPFFSIKGFASYSSKNYSLSLNSSNNFTQTRYYLLSLKKTINPFQTKGFKFPPLNYTLNYSLFKEDKKIVNSTFKGSSNGLYVAVNIRQLTKPIFSNLIALLFSVIFVILFFTFFQKESASNNHKKQPNKTKTTTTKKIKTKKTVTTQKNDPKIENETKIHSQTKTQNQTKQKTVTKGPKVFVPKTNRKIISVTRKKK
ncbi:hypothetical protein M0813_28252 [Anaeramoeba flamelloides]|uniref:Translocon-associated protein subunit alpha n=1 Tax=Anaeramoeba flamelloides TaxID=1746091 RepID=A0ABQ8XTN9_9EUKA|nr:hypothetical protein M0813_28252 [Anaeramoeba flamelloides]